jgi:two-component system, NtrC family, nitrogen regulation sensor histidine kinase NtrY
LRFAVSGHAPKVEAKEPVSETKPPESETIEPAATTNNQVKIEAATGN